MDRILSNTNENPALPSTIGHDPNDSWETPELVRPGAYDNTRSESGSNVSSGRGSLRDDCIIKGCAHLPQPDSFPLTRADIARSGEPGGMATSDLRVTSRIFGNNAPTNPRNATPTHTQSFPVAPNPTSETQVR